jgi:hypothetical protein
MFSVTINPQGQNPGEEVAVKTFSNRRHLRRSIEVANGVGGCDQGISLPYFAPLSALPKNAKLILKELLMR